MKTGRRHMSARQAHAPKHWWKKEFGRTYFNLYNPVLNADRTATEIRLLRKCLPLLQNMNILDLGCGHGRHTIELTRQGFTVTGLDYSDVFLNIARKEAEKKHVSVQLVKQDMRTMNYKGLYDVVISMYSAFGYFPYSENRDLLQRVYNALKPGGKFLIDVINAEGHVAYIREHGKKMRNGVYEYTQTNEVDGYKLIDTNIYYEKTQLDSYHRIWKKNTRKGSYNYYMYQYTLPQYKTLLEGAGFQIENLYGDYKGTRWTSDSWRTIILCNKPTGALLDINKVRRFMYFSVLRRFPKQRI